MLTFTDFITIFDIKSKATLSMKNFEILLNIKLLTKIT